MISHCYVDILTFYYMHIPHTHSVEDASAITATHWNAPSYDFMMALTMYFYNNANQRKTDKNKKSIFFIVVVGASGNQINSAFFVCLFVFFHFVKIEWLLNDVLVKIAQSKPC